MQGPLLLRVPIAASSLWSGALLLLLAGLLPVPAGAQHAPDTTATDADVTLEAFLEDGNDEEEDPTQLIEHLDRLRTDPLDVNTASADDLAQLPSIGPALARRIVAARTRHGPFGSPDELRERTPLPDAAYLAARPYLTVSQADRPTAPSFRVELIQSLGRRLDTGRGYRAGDGRSAYPGAPTRLYTRLRARLGSQVQANLTLEKDPGERFGWNPSTGTYGYDHATAHVALSNLGPLKTLILGDYAATFGQGVVLWRNSAFGKGRDPVRPLIRAGQGLVPYGSTEENLFFRGVAATGVVLPGVEVSGWASRRTLDAAVVEPADGRPYVTGLTAGGLHRTSGELGKKDALREDLLGSNLDVQGGPVRVGVVGYLSRYSHPFRPGAEPSRRFRFTGRRAAMVGVYGDVFWGPAHVFGEVARSPGAALGGVGGLSMRLSDRLETVVAARRYPPSFVSLHGHAFGERNGSTTNETGYYLGLQITPRPTWRLAAYYDQYRFPWVQFGVPRPSTGSEIFFLIEHRPRSWLTVYVQGRRETRETGVPYRTLQGRLLDAVLPETRQSLRVHGDYRFGARLRLRARLELVRHTPPSAPHASGMTLYQDVRWRPLRSLQLDLRLAVFDTGTYEARIYTYENDLFNTFSVPALFGQGHRAYALLHWTPTNRFTVQAKIAATRREHVRSIGSGLDEVPGNTIRNLRVLFRWKI